MIYCYSSALSGIQRPRATFGQFTDATKQAALPLMIPVILLGGILTGWFTPTEAGVVAVSWILLVVILSSESQAHPQAAIRFLLRRPDLFAAADHHRRGPQRSGWMLAYLRGAIVISDVITSMAGSDPHLIMLLLVCCSSPSSAISSSRSPPSSSSCPW